MGVDCRIMLPGNVRVGDVADVLAILDGAKAEKRPLGNDSYAAHVIGVKVEGLPTIPTCANITWTSGEGERRSALYHFEADNGAGRLLLPRSNAWWIAAGRALVDFFGGRIDYQDCDDSECDYDVPAKGNAMNCPNDGKSWHNLQDRKLVLQALTREELLDADQDAAYKQWVRP